MRPSLRIQDFAVTERRLIDRFIKVPWQIYHDDPVWVPPLIHERKNLLSAKHPYFAHATARFWLAEINGQPAGRISAQVDWIKARTDQDKVGYFGMFECIDDLSVSKKLFECAETWLQSQQCELVRDPFNLSINQESGLLVEGFNSAPYIMMGHARPYYQSLIIGQGYTKVKDLYAWLNHTDFDNPVAMRRVLDRYKKSITLRNADKKNIKRDMRIMLDIFNNAWRDNWGFIPFTEHEFFHMSKQMLQLASPEYFKIAEYEGQPVGMIAGLPNFNEFIKDLNGRLFPGGIFKLLWRLKTSRPATGRVPLLGIKRQYQNQLLGSALALLLIAELQQFARRLGYRQHELSWVLEDNVRLNKILASLGAEQYKTYRLFEKKLVA